jgi:hypothetical protein
VPATIWYFSESISFANFLASVSVGKVSVRLTNAFTFPSFGTATETNQRFFTVRLAMCFEVSFVGRENKDLGFRPKDYSVVVIRVPITPLPQRKGISLDVPMNCAVQGGSEAARNWPSRLAECTMAKQNPSTGGVGVPGLREIACVHPASDHQKQDSVGISKKR